MPNKTINDEARRTREIYRCGFCGKFTPRGAAPFFDREDRADESSSILPFCSETHADANHRRNVQREYDRHTIYTAPALPV